MLIYLPNETAKIQFNWLVKKGFPPPLKSPKPTLKCFQGKKKKGFGFFEFLFRSKG